MSFIINSIINSLDSLFLGYRRVTDDLGIAKETKDPHGLTEARLKRAKNYVDLSTYAVMGMEHVGTGKISQIASIFAAYSPIDFKHLSISLPSILSGLTTIAAPLIFAIEGFSFLREGRILKCLQNIPDSCETASEKEQLKQCLQALSEENSNDVLKSLPDYLREKIQNLQNVKLQDFSRNGQSIFDHWMTEVDKGRPITAFNILHEMRQGIERKKCLHSIGMLAAAITLVIILGTCIGIATALLSAIEILGIFVSVLLFLLAKGVVENHKEGFSWRLCLPAFMHKKLGVTREYNIKMKAPDYTWLLKERQESDYSSSCSNDF